MVLLFKIATRYIMGIPMMYLLDLSEYRYFIDFYTGYRSNEHY